MEEQQIPWEEWARLLVEVAVELKESGMQLKEDPSEDVQALRNIIAISAAEWRKGDDVNLDGPSMGKALGEEESYSPVQVYMPVWGKDTTASGDVTLINSPYVPEFKDIDTNDLIKLISTDTKLAAKAAVILMQNNRGYDIWSTWSIVNKEPAYFEFSKDFTIPKKTEVPSDAIDLDRIYTPGYEPGTGRPLDDGKTIPFTEDVSTARESTLRKKQGRYLARIKFKNALSQFGEEVDVDK